ncbi:Ig-like domain-containing protein [Moraxella sp. VT-16-12]|uniref:Ig-like domain-containing protein n=1 Tax=Moraxella sp. VT-16-12 TaxID=2014877 RepID=UPI000B7D0F27|nr:Ig-like domain-containing protein [Moraxella sp. VT-16-12]TWV82414.1 hypothetical protein CEW93_005785 [Moraxella sp. VT-16-12]
MLTINIHNNQALIHSQTIPTRANTPHIIRAIPQVNYELLNPQTNHAPDYIIAQRRGKDLHIYTYDMAHSPDVIIEGFYNYDDTGLVGFAENSQYYYYIPDSAEVVDYITNLDDNAIQGHALGGFAMPSPWWVSSAISTQISLTPFAVGAFAVAGAGVALKDYAKDHRNGISDDIQPAPQLNQVGVINIQGALKVGQTLTATVADGDGVPNSIAYQWFRGGQAIQGATGNTYVLIMDDKDATISVQATYKDNAGNIEKLVSIATAPIAEPADTTPPTLTISIAKSDLLAGESTLVTFKVSEPVQNFESNDVVVKNGSLSGFTKVDDTTYTATYTADKAGQASLTVAPGTFSDLAWNQNDKASELALSIKDAPPLPADVPTVSLRGDVAVVEGQSAAYNLVLDKPAQQAITLTVHVVHEKSNGSDVQATSYTVTIPAGEDSTTLQIPTLDNNSFAHGKTFRVEIANAQGAKIDAQENSTVTAISDNDPPPPPQLEAGSEKGSAVITPQAGTQALTVHFHDESGTAHSMESYFDSSRHIWQFRNDPPAGITLNAQSGIIRIAASALQNGSEVRAENASEYNISESGTLRLNDGNDNTPDTTAPVLTISADKPFLTGKGESAQLTFKLSEPVQNFAANDIQVNNGRIDNFVQVDATTYTATYTGVGSGDIRVAAGAFSDLAFNQNAETGLRIPLSVPGNVVINGLPKVGENLSASITDDNGVPGVVQYQWLADGKAITSATRATYTVRSEDAGKTISVRVIYQDGENFSEDVTSDATAPVQGDNVHVFANIAELMAAPLKADDKALITDFNHVNDNIGIRYTISDTLPDAAQGLLNRVAVPLANGKYALPQLDDYTLPVENSAANTKAMLQVATTYLDAGDKLVWDGNGETPLYVSGTPKMVKTPSGKEAFAITCSAFINMVMAGWKFEDTTYANNQNTSSYGWGIDFQDKPQGDKGPYSANAQLKWMYWKNQVALYNGKSGGEENYRVGDILFFSKQDPEGAGTGGNFFMNVYHSAIYIGNGKIMHSAGTYHGNGVVIETLNPLLKSNLTWIGRPHLGNSTITIEGEAKVGATLTAKAADADGLPADGITYQWYADNRPIDGATAQTYTLTDADKGKSITVRAKFSDGTQYLEAPTSAATAQVTEDTPAPPPPAADTTAPTLTISATPSMLMPGSSTQLTFKASEAVKGFTADDVIVQGGTLSNFRQVDAKTFTATFTAGAAGKASVTVADDAFVDLADNPNELANLELVIDAAPTPQNHAPTDITLSADRLPENKSGAIVGKLATVDPDANDSHTYAVNDNRFEVDAQGNLKLKDGVKVEFAQEKAISLEITTTDQGGEKYSETFAINVQDDPNYPAPQPTPNQAPTDIALSATTLPENQAGAIVGKLTTTDPDQGDKHTYTVSDQRFEVDAQGNLKLKAGETVDFAQEPNIKLNITTTDQGGASYQETFTLNVQDDPTYPAPNGGKLGVYVPKPATDFIANVKDAAYGAKGDGQTDDTAAIQKAIDAVAAKGGGIVEIPAGTYMINGAATSVLGPGDVPRTSGLQVKSNVIIRMADDTVMQVIPNGEKHYDIFNIYNAENVAIMGGTLRGDRHSHLNDQGEWGSGIKIASAKNVVIEKVIAREFWGDAVHISDSGSLPRTPSQNVTIYQLAADGNRRQGISITSADKVLIEDSAFKNTGGQGGTPPMAGIDIEPESQQQVSNVTIKNSTFDNNTGYGIALLERADVENADIRNIVIDGNTIKTGGAGIVVNNTGGHTITNNHISDIGKGWYYGSQHSLALNANSHDNTVTGNTVKTGSIIDAGQNNSVSGNIFESVAFVRGENKVGATLAAEVHNDDGAPRNLGYQWLADGKPINGATAATYTVRPEDAGKRISVEASFDKDGGVRETTEYEVPTLPIAGTPNPPTNDGKLGVHVPKPITDFIANAKEFGAKGDGQSDDTTAIQKAIDAVAEKGGGIVEIPAGTYMVDAVNNRLHMKSHVILRLTDDTVLKAITNGETHYDLIRFRNVDNAHIIGGTLEGDRETHTGIDGEAGHGIRLMAATNITIENVTLKNMWGDGIYLGKDSTHPTQNENVTVYQVTSDHNRRQGLSVTHGKNIKILNSIFQNTDGTDPRAGIDLEPNAGQDVSNVEIRGNQFLDNHIGFLVANNSAGSRVQNVVFENNTLSGNPRDAIILRGLEGGSIKGNTIHIDPDAHHHDSGGIRLYNGDYHAVKNPDPRPTRDVEITGNTLYGGTIMPRDTSGNTIADNQFKAAVFIRGNAQNGEELTAQFYDGNGTSKAANVQYQWLADSVPIGGATAARYTPSAADRGKTLTVKVSFTDNAGQTESAESDATPPVDNIRNQTPTDITLSADRLPENQAGAVIGKLATVDPDAGDSHTYTVNDQRFEVDAQGNLKLKDGVKVEFAQEKTIALEITTTDKGGEKYSETFTLQVQDDPNYPAPNPPTPPNDGKLGVYVPKPATDFIANVKDAAYGAKGDGQTDDTAAIQKAIDAAAEKGGGVVDIPGGTYRIDGLKGVHLRSNVTVRMADDTLMQADINQQTGSNSVIFRLRDVENSHILGGSLQGTRDSGAVGSGYGVLMYSVRNVVIENVTSKDFLTDGFYLGRDKYREPTPKDVVFYNVTADNNTRQGLSITNGDNINVIRSTFKNTFGVSPQAGIDIEPNPSAHSPVVGPDGETKVPGKVTNVEIIDSVFENNAAEGIIVSANGDAVIENVRILNNQLHGNRDGIKLNGLKGGEVAGNTIHDDGRGIPYFDIETYATRDVHIHDNVMYGGKMRSEAQNTGVDSHNITTADNQTHAAVYVKGALKTGATVFAQVEDGDGVPLARFIQYQWQIEGKDIAGATNREYTIRPEDSGKSLSVRVEFPDGSKQTETAVSKPTLPIDSLTNNAAPTDIRADRPLLVDEGQAGASAGRVRTVDGDRGDDHVYTVSDNRFEIDAYGHLKLKSGETLDYGKEQNIDLTITATDRAGNELSKPFSVAVKDNPNIGTPPTPPAPNPPGDGKLGVHVPKPTTDFVANVKDAAYGAKGDGKADDTLAVQKAIDAVAEQGGGVVEMPGGTYMIDATAQQGPHSLSRNYPSGLMMKPNVILKLADDTVLKAIPTDQERYNLITFYKADNAHLIGGTLIGERDQHKGLTGQYGYGVRVISSKDVVIEKVTAKDFWGDGFYVGINSGADPQSQNVTFYNVVADNNRRQGLSITDAKGVKVLDSVFKNTSGHMPQSGIDVEPNPGRSTTDIDIRGNRFEGNTGFGVVVSGSQFNRKDTNYGKAHADTVTKNINVEDNTFTGNSDGIWISGLAGGRVAGNTIHYANVAGGPTGGIRKLRLDDMSRDIVVENNTIYGGGYPHGYTEHGKLIEGGGIENLGQNNIVRNNDYKADVFIRGLVKSGETLTAHVYDGDIVSADVRYQWRADGKAIDGATSRSYRLTDANNGKRISVHVEFTDGADEKESVTSAETNPVGSPQPNHAPQWAYVRGNYIADETPGHVIGKFGVHDPDPGETFTYRVSDERFEIVAGVLKLKDGISIDDANEKKVALAIEVTDSAGASFVRELDLIVAKYDSNGKDISTVSNTHALLVDATATIVAVSEKSVTDTKFLLAKKSKLNLDNLENDKDMPDGFAAGNQTALQPIQDAVTAYGTNLGADVLNMQSNPISIHAKQGADKATSSIDHTSTNISDTTDFVTLSSLVSHGMNFDVGVADLSGTTAQSYGNQMQNSSNHTADITKNTLSDLIEDATDKLFIADNDVAVNNNDGLGDFNDKADKKDDLDRHIYWDDTNNNHPFYVDKDNNII